MAPQRVDCIHLPMSTKDLTEHPMQAELETTLSQLLEARDALADTQTRVQEAAEEEEAVRAALAALHEQRECVEEELEAVRVQVGWV